MLKLISIPVVDSFFHLMLQKQCGTLRKAGSVSAITYIKRRCGSVW